MKVVTGSNRFKAPKGIVVTLGVFDGVHRGHEQLFQRVLRDAKKRNLMAVAYTFHPHPARVLVPEACPPMITTLEQKLELMSKTGLQATIVEPFTRTYAHQSPEAFFKNILVKRLHAREVVVGYDFTFGVHRSGTLTQLKKLAEASGIRVHIVPPYLWKETIISSTQIRQRLASGQLERAEPLLGRPYFMEGKVMQGRGIGGQLGIHTANLRSENDLILPTGVYVTLTRVMGKSYHSVTNIGPNPTFGTNPLSIETHLLHFDRSIRGKVLRVEFLKKIREEISFPSPKELAVQIHHDIAVAQQYLSKRHRLERH